MTLPQTKETLIRMSWLTELRRQGERKCEGVYSQSFGRYTQVCALGLLSEVAYGEARWADEEKIGALAGLNANQSAGVVAMNDGLKAVSGQQYLQHTFSEIADVVEGWFKK